MQFNKIKLFSGTSQLQLQDNKCIIKHQTISKFIAFVFSSMYALKSQLSIFFFYKLEQYWNTNKEHRTQKKLELHSKVNIKFYHDSMKCHGEQRWTMTIVKSVINNGKQRTSYVPTQHHANIIMYTVLKNVNSSADIKMTKLRSQN